MFFSLRNRLFVLFSLVFTVPFLVLSIVVPYWLTARIEDQTRELSMEKVSQASFSIESITTQAEDIGKQVLINESTQGWMDVHRRDAGLAERFNQKSELQSYLSSIMINNAHSMSIGVFLSDGLNTWREPGDLNDLGWYVDFQEREVTFTRSHIDANQQTDEMIARQVNSLILPLFDLNTIEAGGVIKINIPTAVLEEAIQSSASEQSGRMLLVNNEGENVLMTPFQTPPSVIREGLQSIEQSGLEGGVIEVEGDGETYFLFYERLADTDWILMNEIKESVLFQQVNELQQALLVIAAVLFFMTIVASFVFSSSVTEPLGKLAGAMKYLERGDFAGAKTHLPRLKSDQEVGYLVNVMDHTMDRLKATLDETYTANLKRKDAEYKALLLQINPHFLNNTLEIIGSLAMQEKHHDVTDVSVYLGKMLRYSLRTDQDTVRLKEEFSYIHQYLAILQLRYEDQLHVDISLDPSAEDMEVPKFILQPLVENAVKYSFSTQTEARLVITAEKTASVLRMTVRDYGAGMDEQKRMSLSQLEESAVLETDGQSIGLRNVLSRLSLYFGQDFSYSIHSQEGRGTEIVLEVRQQRGEMTG